MENPSDPVLENLLAKRSALDDKIRARRAEWLSYLEHVLNGRPPLAGTDQSDTDTEQSDTDTDHAEGAPPKAKQKKLKNGRHRKGEALKKIKALFRKAVARDGLTMPDISARTGLPWSTVRNVLKKPDNGFVREENVWYVAED